MEYRKEVPRSYLDERAIGVNSLDVGKVTGNSYLVDKNVHIWNLQNNCKESTFEGHFDIIKNITFSKNNKCIASVGNNRTLKIWNIEKKSQEVSLECNWFTNIITSSHNGKYFVYGEKNNIKIWDLENKCMNDG